jgi:hypothetical protein
MSIHFPFFEDLAARTVTTLRGRLDLKDLPEVYSRSFGLDIGCRAGPLPRREQWVRQGMIAESLTPKPGIREQSATKNGRHLPYQKLGVKPSRPYAPRW